MRNATVVERLKGNYTGRLGRGSNNLVMKRRSCTSDPGAIELWDSCGKAANSAFVRYLDRDTAALEVASLTGGDTVQVEYVGTGECPKTGHDVAVVAVVRLLRSPPAARQHATR